MHPTPSPSNSNIIASCTTAFFVIPHQTLISLLDSCRVWDVATDAALKFYPTLWDCLPKLASRDTSDDVKYPNLSKSLLILTTKPASNGLLDTLHHKACLCHKFKALLMLPLTACQNTSSQPAWVTWPNNSSPPLVTSLLQPSSEPATMVTEQPTLLAAKRNFFSLILQ